MDAYRNLFGDQLTEVPKRNYEKQQKGYNSHLGWVFVCNQFHKKPKAVRTYHSLFGASEAYTYYTPNTFYRNDQRHAGALRWLNAMVIDIDVKNDLNKGMIFPDVLENINAAGLPAPSMVISTPSGGFHVYWNFTNPRRAFPRLTEHYCRVQRAIAEAVQGDPQAVGAERWFRMPTDQNTLYKNNERVSFDDLCDWLSIYQEETKEKRLAVCVDTSNLVHHPAIQKLLQGVSEGQRDNTCYTLALAFKATGHNEHETECYLQEWNERNDPSMLQIDVKRKVKSAFKQNAPAGPSAYWIRTLSGLSFTYQNWELAKPRDERTYSHLDEWKDDVIQYLKVQGGSVSGSQRTIAQAIKSSSDKSKCIPYSTFKKVIEHLVQIGIVIKTVEGKGRAAETTLKLIKKTKVVPLRPPNEPKKNGFNSNTFLDPVVGGFYFRFSGLLIRGNNLGFSSRSSP